MADTFLKIETADGSIWACVSPESRYVTGAVSRSKLEASLHPFRDEAGAQAALEAMNGPVVKIEQGMEPESLKRAQQAMQEGMAK